MIDSPRPFLSWVVFKSGCCFFLWMLCRAVAVELEVTKGLSKLLYSVESVYLGIVREVAAYAVEHNVPENTLALISTKNPLLHRPKG